MEIATKSLPVGEAKKGGLNPNFSKCCKKYKWGQTFVSRKYIGLLMEHFNLRAWKARDREHLLCSETDILSVTETDTFYEWLNKFLRD